MKKKKTILMIIAAATLISSQMSEAGRISSGGNELVPAQEQIRNGQNYSCEAANGAKKTLRISVDGSKVELYDFTSFCVFTCPKESMDPEFPDAQVFRGTCDSISTGTSGIVVEKALLPDNGKVEEPGKVFQGETYECLPPAGIK